MIYRTTRLRVRNAMILLAASMAIWVTIGHRAKADDSWPCEAVMCLSNPGGPTEYGQCVPPMEKFWQCLADPTCGFPGCHSGGVDANIGYQPPLVCPLGTVSQRVDGGTLECLYTASQGNVYQVAPVANPYNMSFVVSWSGGGETLYVNSSNQTQSTTDPPPPMSAQEIEYFDSQPRDECSQRGEGGCSSGLSDPSSDPTNRGN